MFYEFAEPILNEPSHRLRIRTIRGVPLRAITSYDLGHEEQNERSLLLVYENPEIRRLMNKEESAHFEHFKTKIKERIRHTAIGTAKNVALSVLSEPELIPYVHLTVHHYGVIPVFSLKSVVSLKNSNGESKPYHVAVFVEFPSPAKSIATTGKQAIESRNVATFSADSISEDYLILQGYDIELLTVFIKYFEDIADYFRLMMDHASGDQIFPFVREIKSILSTQIGIKIKHFFDAINDNLRISETERDAAIYIAEQNIEWLIMAELASHLIHQLLAKYLSLYRLGYDQSRLKDFDEFRSSLLTKWRISSDKLTELVENSHELTSVLYEACSDPRSLFSLRDERICTYDWFNIISELETRISFYRDEKISLAEFNIFLSRRTDCEFSKMLVESAKTFPKPINLYSYYRLVPPRNEFPKEIRWYIWACHAFLSLLSDAIKSDLEEGPVLNLDWIVKELDLAFRQGKHKIIVIKSRNISDSVVMAQISSRSFEFFEGFEIPYSARIEAITKIFDGSKTVHIDYDKPELKTLEIVTKDILNWSNQQLLDVSELYFKGWVSLLSDNSKKLVRYVCKSDRERISKGEIEKNLGLNSKVLSDVRENLNKYPVTIDNKNITLVGFRQRTPNRNSTYDYFNNFDEIFSILYPGVDINALRDRI